MKTSRFSKALVLLISWSLVFLAGRNLPAATAASIPAEKSLFATVPAPALTNMLIATGDNHTMAIKTDGTLWAWGSNRYGQLGDGTTNDRTAPVKIGTDTDWATVAGGNDHTIALKSDGTLWAWGTNYSGQLGNGTMVASYSPLRIGTDTNWASITAGQYHSVALKTDGSLWAWGYNGYGQLGDGTMAQSSIPVRIGTDTNWSAVAARAYHTIALKGDGTLWSWGYNYQGLLGDGTNYTRYSPLQIGTGTDWATISAAGTHTLAIKVDGTLWGWGHNYYGWLGTGNTTAQFTPVQIGSDSDWAVIAAGGVHTAALKTDKSLWTWGFATYLGDNSVTDRYSPAKIGTDTNWSALAAGEEHTVVLKTDGSLWSWGYNYYGQLGDGTTTLRSAVARTIAITTNPANGAANVPYNGAIRATFNEAMKPSTFDSTTFTMTGPAGEVSGAVTFDSGTNTATFTPFAPLVYKTAYTATITTAVTDISGYPLGAEHVWSFTVEALPAIIATSPVADATNVAVPAVISAVFNKPMDAATFDGSTFMVSGVTGVVTYNETSNTATFMANLAGSTTYTATITSGARDPSGNSLVAEYSWSFTTAPAFTLTVSSSGTGGGTVTSLLSGINCGATCAAEFSENSIVALKALPATGSFFSGWTGPCAGGSSSQSFTCLVTMDGVKSATATFVSGTPPQTSWARTYGTSSHEGATASQQTADGGFILAGTTGSVNTNGNNDFWVVKLDASGHVAWQKAYGGTDTYSGALANAIQQTADGGYIVAGVDDTCGDGCETAWVLKLNVDGAIAWQKHYDNNYGDSVAYAARQTSDGGYVIAGSLYSYYGEGGSREAWLMKLNAEGEVQWQKGYGGYGSDQAYSVRQTADGGYVFTGATGYGAYAWIVRVDAAGGVVWERRTASEYSFGYDVQQTLDKGFVVTGTLNSELWVAKLNQNGIFIWQKTYGGGEGRGIQQSNDGGYVVAGNTLAAASGSNDFWLLKLGSSGTVEWGKTYGGYDAEQAYSVSLVAEGGALVAGYTYSASSGYSDAWLLKLRSDGGITFAPESGVSLTDTPAVITEVVDTGAAEDPMITDPTAIAAVTDVLAVDSSATVIAQHMATITTLLSGGGTGTVTSSPPGINCGSTCSASHLPGTAVTLAAMSGPDSTFTGWSGGGCSGTGTCVITMDTDTNVTAAFSVQADTIPPTDGNLIATPGTSQIVLSWTAAADNVEVAGYKLVTSTTALPIDCSGAALYSGTGLSYSDNGLSNGITSYYRVCAVDTAGNWSPGATATFTPAVDTVAPTIIAFIIPVSSSTLIVPVTTFTATDNVGVTGYLPSENAAPPLATDSGWAAAAPAAYTLATWGNRILYAYAKDAAGNISAAGSAPIYVGIKPDVDGVIVPMQSKVEPQLADALKSLNFAMKAETPTATEMLHGDVAPLVNGVPHPDGEINLGDTIVTLRRVVGLYSVFP